MITSCHFCPVLSDTSLFYPFSFFLLQQYQTTFRFPGETQQIERLVEKFSYRYLECNPDLPRVRKPVPDPDVTRVTIMSSQDSDSSENIQDMGNGMSNGNGAIMTGSSCNSSVTSSVSSSNHMSSSSNDASSNASDDVSSDGAPMTRDEVFILSFAIIMLNTDLHVPSNKSRMTCVQWIKNLKVILEQLHDE